jgi:hypothetical protein
MQNIAWRQGIRIFQRHVEVTIRRRLGLRNESTYLHDSCTYLRFISTISLMMLYRADFLAVVGAAVDGPSEAGVPSTGLDMGKEGGRLVAA